MQRPALEERLELKAFLLPSSYGAVREQPFVTECSKNIQIPVQVEENPCSHYSKQNISASVVSLPEGIPCCCVTTRLALTANRAVLFHSSMNAHELSWDEKPALSSIAQSQQFWIEIRADLSTFTS